MKRAALIGLLLFGCAPPQQLHGVEAFDAWQRANVQIVNVDLPEWSGCDKWENGAGILYVDLPCMVSRSYGKPEFVDFLLRHAQAHAVDFRLLGLARGTSDCNAVTCKSWEETAQCGAEVLTGITFASDPALGYWDCPPEEVERIRALMIAKGVW